MKAPATTNGHAVTPVRGRLGAACAPPEVLGGMATAAQPVLDTLVESRVTAPLRARRRPITLAPVAAAIESLAITVPTRLEPLPRVADDGTIQNTLHGFALLISAT